MWTPSTASPCTPRWDHDQDLTGKQVGIIGTGASAVQVIPLAPIVNQLTVFQRTPIWCFPKFHVPLPPAARWAMRIPGGTMVQRLLSQAFVELTFTIAAQYFTVVPLAKRMGEMGRRYLAQQVEDPDVRERLTPGTRWAASGRASTTSTWPPTTATTCGWSPKRSTR